MSAHPLLDNKQLQKQKIKMAMALRGKNKHYRWNEIQSRHFVSTAEKINFSPTRMQQLLTEMTAQADDVVEQVSKRLPKGFPSHVSDPVFSGILQAAQRLS